MTAAAGQQRIPARPWRQAAGYGEILLTGTGGGLAVVALVHTLTAGIVQPRVALAFGALIALGELLRLALPGDREAAPIATAAALAYALLRGVGAAPALQSSLQVVALTAVGMTLGVLPHLVAGRPVGADGMAARLLVVAGVAFTFRPLAHTGDLGAGWHVALVVMTGLLVAGWWAECLLRALIRVEAFRARFRVTLWDEMRVALPLGGAVAATAMLIAFAAQDMGLAALAVFIGPLLVTQVAFRRYAGIRTTYLQTVRALARVTEVGGYVADGHAHRVSRLAVAVGRALGMSEPDLLELEYAALMHDIGQLSLRTPIPGGATVLASPADQRRIAELGAGVIEQARVLDGVAEIVRCQVRPWQEGHGGPLPIGSRIIRVVNAFDDLVGESADPSRRAAVLQRLRLDAGSEYDPAVVDALSQVAASLPVPHR